LLRKNGSALGVSAADTPRPRAAFLSKESGVASFAGSVMT
jgi:hypothetical protein